MTGKALVLGSDTRSFLSVIRSLGRRGIEVHVGWCPPEAAAARSGYVHRAHRLPTPTDNTPDSWLEEFAALMVRERFDLVLPTNDPTLIPLQFSRAQLEPLGKLYLLDERAFQTTFDKVKTRELALANGVSVAPGALVTEAGEVDTALAGRGYPLVVKPQASFNATDLHRRNEVTRAYTPEAVRAAIADLLRRGDVLVEENLNGVAYGVEVLAMNGKILLSQQHERLHEPLHGGGSSYRRTVARDPAFIDAVSRLLRALDYTGVAMFEFKRDPFTGRWILIEVNGRFWGSLPLSLAAGIDFPYALWQLLVEGRQEFDDQYRTGVYARNLKSDAKWLWLNLRADRHDPVLATRPLPTVAAELLNVLRQREHSDTFVLDDPRPGFAELAHLGRGALELIDEHLRLRTPLHRAHRRRAQRALRHADSVLFVCLGNICRSPFAAAVARDRLPASVEVQSAGTGCEDGRSSPAIAQRVAREFGANLDRHRSRRVTRELVEGADVVFVFDEGNRRELRRRYRDARRKIQLIGALSTGPLRVRDPVDGGEDEFRETYSAIAGALGDTFVTAPDVRAGWAPPGLTPTDRRGPGPARRVIYLSLGENPIFGFYHPPQEGVAPQAGVLLVPPFGWDEVCSYRSRRDWADQLARAGHPCLRIDLPGAGDSGGGPNDSGRLAAWIEATTAACRWLLSDGQCTTVAAAGIGLGGLILYRAIAAGAPVDQVVLWATPSTGQAVVRQLRAFARLEASTLTSRREDPASAAADGDLAVGGFVLSAETLDELSSFDATTFALPARRPARALLLGRDGLAVDAGLQHHLEAHGTAVTVNPGFGYGAMMTEPQDAKPPIAIFEQVRAWLAEGGRNGAPMRSDSDTPESRPLPQHEFVEMLVDGSPIRERALEVDLSSGIRLIGVLSEPAGEPAGDLAVVALNAGAIRRIGPNRMWVEAARRWAARGIPSLRLDLEGLGDADGDADRFHDVAELYVPEYFTQVRAALDLLEDRGIAQRFVLLGLCSGAFWSFHGALRDERVTAAFMVNPRTLLWDASLQTMRYLQRALLQPTWVWGILASGNVPRSQVVAAVRRAPASLMRTVARARHPGASELERALDQLGEDGKHLAFFFSGEEPLYDELKRDGYLHRPDRWPHVEVQTIPGRDHTLRPTLAQRHAHDLLDNALDREIERTAPPMARTAPPRRNGAPARVTHARTRGIRSMWVPALKRIHQRRSIILGYHGVADARRRDDLSMLQVSPTHFRTHVELLIASGFRFLTVSEMARRLREGALEPGHAAVTFDDGMLNNHRTALPILREYGIAATVYVAIDFIGGRSPWISGEADGRMMGVPELRDLVAAGWELGAHTMSHADLSKLDYDGCRREIEESRDALQRLTGAEVRTFAYPFGRYGPASIQAVRDAGLLAAVTTGSGSWDAFELTRAMIGAADPFPVVLLKLTDRYEPLLQAAPLRALRRSSKALREVARARQRDLGRQTL